MKNFIYLFSLLISTTILASSCGDDNTVIDGENPTKNLVEIAQENGFSSLATALTLTDLVDDLQGATDFTVFAPTNEAFNDLLAAIGQTSIEDVPVSVLEQVLLYHVVPGKVFSSDIADGGISTLEGSQIDLATSGGITVNDIPVANPFDVEATNGVIHTIETVLVPTSVGQFVNTVLAPAYFNKNFSTLIEAAVKAEVVETLLATPNLTIFAPNNDAFNGAGIVPADINKETLVEVLTYHVIGSKVLSSQIPREATTLNGNKTFFSITSDGAFINGSTKVVAVDIESGSGVVHVIDNVLMPPSGNIVETAIALSAGGEFTSLIAALQRTANEGTAEQNLLTVLSGEGPFTVFAPTNAAFQALLDSNSDWASLNDIPLATLIEVLTYHVVPARAYDKDIASALDTNNELSTAQGTNLSIDLSTLTINGNSKIVVVNANATNGVIHVIDSVLLP